MHLTKKVVPGGPDLRQPWVRDLFRELVDAAAERGVRTVAFSIMRNHLHWMVLPGSRAELADATRYLFGMLARRVNSRLGRRGKLFVERYFSRVCRAVSHAFRTLNYLLRNPFEAGMVAARVGYDDEYTRVNEPLIDRDGFLASALGTGGPERGRLLRSMFRERLVFTPLVGRLQRRLC